MVLESSARITEQGIANLRARVGSYYTVQRGDTQATADNIRHFCGAIGDHNPLYIDPDYARKSRLGRLQAPPTFLYSVIHPTGMRTGGMPGVHAFHSGNDWEYLRRIQEGDILTGSYRPISVVEKRSQMGGRSVIVYAEIVYFNQRADAVARTIGWTIRVERQASQERGKYKAITKYRHTDEEIERILAAYAKEAASIRGATPRYWEDVQVGEELPPVVKGPLNMGDMIAWRGVFGHPAAAHGLALREMKRHPAFTFRDPKTGAMQRIAQVHEDAKAAESAGVPGAYDIGAQRNCWLGTVVTNWMGDEGFMTRLYAEYRRFNIFGDVQWGKGKVTGKRVANGSHLVDMDVWFENQRGEVTTPGHATVSLPSRAGK